MSILWEFFTRVLEKLDMNYWCTHCGVDGYIYLLFQRKILQLTLCFSILALLFSIPINTLFLMEEDWIERILIHNKTLSNSTAWFHVLMVVFITAMTFKFMIELRE
jgi:hypothetical protein